MGVPAFYRWLSEKYPKIVQDVLEDRVHLAHDSGSIRSPFDCTRPNPSGLECDNLYIDMNGIIHPCSHPEHGPQPKTEEEMYENVCRYVDRLFRAVRPRKLLYLAIDGVAPRAKMNQQRSRRFRSAQEAREKRELENELKQSLVQQGHKFESSKEEWDSNVITPGTRFMLNLSEYIRFYIRRRISTDKAWRNITVIFSDASIPGEGEHKIMAHIRHQRCQPTHDPNLVHVLHGLDADLIMLALATHEAHFYILREEVLFGRKSAEHAEQRKNESGFTDKQKQLDEAAGADAMELPENKTKPLQRISIPILRDYLAFEFRECNNVPFRERSFERLLDDIVFLCFFVGNDFLPHLPSLDIRDGGLDYLFNVYKRVLPTLGDYITNHGGEVNLSHVDVILAEVASIEDYVFEMKHQNEENEKKRQEQYKARKKLLTKDGSAPLANGGVIEADIPKVQGRAARILAQSNGMTALGKDHANECKHNSFSENAQVAEELKASLLSSDGTGKRKVEEINPEEETEEVDNIDIDDDVVSGATGGIDDDEDSEFDQEAHDESKRILKQKLKEAEQKKLDEYAKSVEDKVRFHEKGWKTRYYSDKCKADDVAENGGREHMYRSYIVGLCWVMKYYYNGCPSWKWFYPFHYAPFASDLKNIERFQNSCTNFDLGEPFRPIEQLMAVLPEDSSHAIPKASRWLMRDQESPIIDFYPKDIACDPNGKAMPWLWVVLLPFIDEDRLLSALKPTEKDWSDYEKLCNARGLSDGYVYCHVSHSLAASITPVIESRSNAAIEDGPISGQLSLPLSTEVYPLDKKSTIFPPKTSHKIENSHNIDGLLTTPIDANAALCAAFQEPSMKKHLSIILKGAKPPDSILEASDYQIRRPRLNRGGGTIANLGTAREGASHQSGYGSMNISSYERQLAERSGRGHQMNQAGTRAWGAMEPSVKRQRYDNNGGHPNRLYQNPFHQQSNYRGNNNVSGTSQFNSGVYNHNSNPRWQPPPHLRQPGHQQFQPNNSIPIPPPPSSRQRYSFQNFASRQVGRGQQGYSHRLPQPGRGNGSSAPIRSGVSSDVMNNLRNQLSSTLNRSKTNNDQRR